MALDGLHPMGLRDVAGIEQQYPVSARFGRSTLPGLDPAAQIMRPGPVGDALDIGRARGIDDYRMAEKTLGHRRYQHGERRGECLWRTVCPDHGCEHAQCL